MTTESILLAALTGAITLIGVLAAMLYRDIVRRLAALDRKSAAALTILTVLLGHIPDIPPELLKTIQVAIAESTAS